MLRSCLAAVLMCLFAGPSAWTQEWSRFRGPNGDGHSDATTIPAAWDDEDIAWKVELPGKGNSSPVLWGDRIFVTSAGPDGTRHVLCLSSRNGQLLWQQDYPAASYHVHQQNTFASSTPAADDKHVYCAWATPEQLVLTALDHQGNDVWQLPLGKFTSQHGFAASPIVYDNLVILTNDQDGDSFIVAADKASGQIRWKVPREVLVEQNAAYSTPCIRSRPGQPDELIVVGRSTGISSLDPQTGETNWELPALEKRPVASPILFESLVLASCGSGGGGNYVVAIEPPDKADGEPQVAYRVERGVAPYVPTMVTSGELIFLWNDRGIASCIDGRSGEVHWQKRIGGNYFSSPVRVADRVYGVSVDGEVVCLAASKEYELLGRSSLGEATRATPAVANGRMFLRTESQLIAVGQP